jgi:hypothetical protein
MSMKASRPSIEQMALIVMAVAFTLPTWPRRHRPVRNDLASPMLGVAATPPIDHFRGFRPAPRPDDVTR